MSGHTRRAKSHRIIALDTYFSLIQTLRFLLSSLVIGALLSCYLWRFIGCLRYILLWVMDATGQLATPRNGHTSLLYLQAIARVI